jgi:hypothetical protein
MYEVSRCVNPRGFFRGVYSDGFQGASVIIFRLFREPLGGCFRAASVSTFSSIQHISFLIQGVIFHGFRTRINILLLEKKNLFWHLVLLRRKPRQLQVSF